MALNDLETGESVLEIVTTLAEPRWRANIERNGGIALEVLGVVPKPTLRRSFRSDGLVHAVTINVDPRGAEAITRFEIHTREPAAYGVRAEQGRLLVRLHPSSQPGGFSAPRPPAAGAPGAPMGSALPAGDPYAIAPGDLLAIEVFGMPELNRKTRVLADGRIALPVVGRIRIAGLTPLQAEQAIGEELVRQGLLRSPQVLVVVEEGASRQVSIQGAVRRPGIYQMARPRTLLEMISEAGGLADTFDSGQDILILRQGPGGQERYGIDGSRLMDFGDPALNVPLQPGDLVLVPAAEQQEVFVSGAVNRPGPVKFLSSSGMTVLRALTTAGGPTERARLGNVRVIRRLPDGTQETLELDVGKIRRGRAEDVPLRNGDTVVVLEWFF
ncbi:MAG TPA: polysaccharide biosynthesis/export family protein [Thermoanaerobaculia bacterium]|nr:polysaccharide biosynthesis/export family protein [Thermoanaerobaculia bacterium]